MVQTSDGRYWLKIDDRLGAYDIYSKEFTPLKTQPTDLLATFQSIGDELYIVDPDRTFLVDRKILEIIPMVFEDTNGNAHSDVVRVSGSTGQYFSYKDSLVIEEEASSVLGRFHEKAEVDSIINYWFKRGYHIPKVDVNGNSWYRRISPSYNSDWIVKDSLGRDVTKQLLEPFQGMVLHYVNTISEYCWFLADKGLILWEKDSEKPPYLFNEIPELRDARLINSFDRDKTNWTWDRQGIHPICQRFSSHRHQGI